MFSEILPFIPTEEANAASDQAEGCKKMRSFDSLRSLRMTGRGLADDNERGLRRAMPAPARHAARDGDELPIAPSTLEKGKTALLPFSPYSGELHGER